MNPSGRNSDTKHYRSLRDSLPPPPPSAGWRARMLSAVEEDARKTSSWWYLLRAPEMLTAYAMALLLLVWQPNWRTYVPGLAQQPQPRVISGTIRSPLIEWGEYFDAMGLPEQQSGTDLLAPVRALEYTDEYEDAELNPWNDSDLWWLDF